MGVRRLVARFAPLVLTGCTVLSGAASLTTGGDNSGGDELQSKDGGSPSSNQTDASPDLPVIDGSFSKDAYVKTQGDPDASEPPPPPPPPPNDAGAGAPDAQPDASGGSDAGGTTSSPITVTFSKSLLEDQEMHYGPFKAKGGTIFDARTTGTGDDDLFLRFGSLPTPNASDCASDGSGPNERCRRTVPANGSDVYLVVYAWLDCSYTLTVTYVPQ